jgi:hypothetical protein
LNQFAIFVDNSVGKLWLYGEVRALFAIGAAPWRRLLRAEARFVRKLKTD